MSPLLPGQLPPQAIDEFQALWKKHYGTDLNRAEATTRAHQFLVLLQIITEPRSKDTPSEATPPRSTTASEQIIPHDPKSQP
jgi:hypothetical protein